MSKWLLTLPAWVLVFVLEHCFIELVKAQNQTQAQRFVTIKWCVYFWASILAAVV